MSRSINHFYKQALLLPKTTLLPTTFSFNWFSALDRAFKTNIFTTSANLVRTACYIYWPIYTKKKIILIFVNYKDGNNPAFFLVIGYSFTGLDW